VLAAFLLLISGMTQADWYSSEHSIMGTNIEVDIWADNQQQADKGLAAVLKTMQDLDQLMSSYIDTSELSRLNREAQSGQAVKVSPALFSVLLEAQRISELSEGAFDITSGVLTKAYDFKQQALLDRRSDVMLERLVPDRAILTAKTALVDYHQLELNATASTARYLQVGMLLDVGGIAKGFAVDQAVAQLSLLGIKHARVTAGGDTRLLGDYRGRDWHVGIKHPRNPEKLAMALPLSKVAVSTSGDYERYFFSGGKRYHHILDPKSGQPVSGVVSATVLADQSVVADGLSTAVFVLGVKQGLALINRLEGIDAILIDQRGKVHYSSGLASPDE
jgi:thiamine biosynthesis lipoprotein